MGVLDLLKQGAGAAGIETDPLKIGKKLLDGDEDKDPKAEKGAVNLKDLEKTLRSVPAANINMPAGKSELLEFVGVGLTKLGAYGDVPTTGQPSAELAAAVNGFVKVKQEEKPQEEEGLKGAWDKLRQKENKPPFADLSPVAFDAEKGVITGLTGKHVQAIVNELRKGDAPILTADSAELLKQLGEGLREIDNSKLKAFADQVAPIAAPVSAPAPAPTAPAAVPG